MTHAWSWHSRRRPAVDLMGQRFGLLTVIAPAPSLGSGARWRCRCECGAERVVTAHTLVRGRGASSHRACTPQPVAETCHCDLPAGTPHVCAEERQIDAAISFIDESDLSETDDAPAPWEEQAEWEFAP